MKTIIHDLKENEIKKIKGFKNYNVITALNCNNSCIGCFSCWVKHPKKCIYNDGYSEIVNKIKDSDELVLISKNRYGCYSSEVKQVLERCIGYVLPFFTLRNKKIHHKSRYKKKIKLVTYFYGNVLDEDKDCINKLVRANAINLNALDYSINYYNNIEELIKCIH